MNPQFKNKEIKYFNNLVEIQLEITKVVLKERKKQEGNCDCNIKNLEKSKKYNKEE